MNWDAIGAVGEIVGAAAVVVTLFYLAIQIRQNNRNSKESLRRLRLGEVDATLQAFSRYRGLLAQSDVAAVYSKGLDDFQDLSDAERVQFGAVMDEYLFSYWSVHHRMMEEAYSEKDWEAHMNSLLAVLRKPGALEWWRIRKDSYPRAFAANVEGHLASQARQQQ